MNYIYILLEVILVFLLMVISYKIGKKDGLFIYLGFMSSMIGILTVKSIDILSFEVNLGIPLIMGIFTCSNIIVQKYGIDEVKDIIKTFAFSYIVTTIIISLTSLMTVSDFNSTTNNVYDSLFGYDLDNVRKIVGIFLSVGLALWYNSYVYYYIRKNKNKYLFSNIGSMLIVQFIESILFVLIAYVGSFDVNMMLGMVVMRYLLKVVVGMIGLLSVSFITNMKS